MKAYRVLRYGDSSGSRMCDDVELPSIADNEVLIRVHAAGVNPIDWKVQEGALKDHFGHELPLTLGCDFAGFVVAAGSLVGRNLIGDYVFGASDFQRDGTFAEFVSVREDHVARAPYTLSATEAASVPLTALTAWTALFMDARLVEGERILIHAGAGGVGLMAVQFAKHAGAHVTATCSAGSANLVHSLGADEIIDYNKEDFSNRSGFDVVLDTVGGEVRDRSWQILRPGGMMVTIVPPYDPDARPRGDVVSTMTGVNQNFQILAHVAGLIDVGSVKPVIAETFAFNEVERALAQSRTGHTHGKLVINIASEAGAS